MRAATTLMTASAFDAPPRPLAGGLGPSPPRRRPRTGVAPIRRRLRLRRRRERPRAARVSSTDARRRRLLRSSTRADHRRVVLARARTDAGATGSSSLAAAFLAGFFPRLRLARALPPPRPRPPPGPLDTAGFSPAHGPSLEDGRGVPVVPSNLVHLSPDGATPRRGDGGGPTRGCPPGSSNPRGGRRPADQSSRGAR